MPKANKYPEEQRIIDLAKALKTKVGDNEPTDAQKKQLDEYRRQLGALKFKRLGQKRVNAALKQINNVGSLAGKSYSCTAAQSAELTTALADAVNRVKAAFDNPGKVTKQAFVFTS